MANPYEKVPRSKFQSSKLKTKATNAAWFSTWNSGTWNVELKESLPLRAGRDRGLRGQIGRSQRQRGQRGRRADARGARRVGRSDRGRVRTATDLAIDLALRRGQL